MGNVVMEATQINYRRDEKLKTVDQKLQELSQESAIDTDIAPVFKSNITYHPGDLVYYRNKLYVFNTEHTGAWAAGDVTATDVSTAMNTALAGKADYADIAGAFNAETAYTAGDLVIYNGIIYRCTNDHTGDWDADDFSATTIGAEINAINSNIATFAYLKKAVYNDKESKTSYTFPALDKGGCGILVGFAEVWAFSYAVSQNVAQIDAVQMVHNMRSQGDRGFTFSYDDVTNTITVTTTSTVWNGIAVLMI